ncbi:A-kinase anchor protein 12b isoform X1 [Syngnathus typhle]|uniref:A-kinase anchor protein 12b isoform X1 n=1 Tax=Syngnathus typhle TaxID=161592 RepID=UPI002A6A6ACC|nr:A-kinase anchor protein 12b isoform X1 [Syngnathus typhle]XP_061127000.1 A-kinase anchor protein 12b isoform X1 [Syngnathus typhle]
MGAESSAQRDVARNREEEDASISVEGGAMLDNKSLHKNGQISSLTSLIGHSEDNTLAEVGQPDGVSVAQKEDTSETMDTIADEQSSQVNGEKTEKESPDNITPVEEKAAEEKPNETGEVGFKKIFRFVGFKFTLKKDKSEEKEPVKLLTVKDKDGDAVNGIDEAGENGITEKAINTEAELTEDAKNVESPDDPGDVIETSDEADKDEGAEKEDEASPPPQEAALSPFRKLFSTNLFSNLRKRSSIKRTKEEEGKEVAGEDEAAKLEEGEESKEDGATTQEKEQAEEEAPASPDKMKPEPSSEIDVTVDSPTSDETKPEEEKAEEKKAAAEVTSDSELTASQEKAKPQGSPLKKLFTGAGLKKLSTKSKKNKKDTEVKLTESGEQAGELQSSVESTEAAKADSGPSSPEKSGEHVAEAEAAQSDYTQEPEGEVVSDGEKKKEGIVAWSSFKKLVTPKKRVKRSSESDDEIPSEKAAKSATLSSSESAPLANESAEEEAKEDKPSEDESKAENTDEKLVSSTEEPKKKMDTSVSWEALMCMGGPKKRTRKTSDSDDEETKIEEESHVTAGEQDKQEDKTEAAAANFQSDEEGASSPEPLSSPPERESTWDTLKRMVMPKSKSKTEEKTEEQVQPESEAPKEESSFSLKKFFPGLRKKKTEKQASTESEEDSDTPAVVPLSEYDAQQEVIQEQAEETAAPAQTSLDERSPSWIAAVVECGDDKHDELSDITEEAENIATPKSVDTGNLEDDAEEHVGRRLSVAEVAQTPPSETTSGEPDRPRDKNAQQFVAAIKAQISEVPPMTSVICEDASVEISSEESEPALEQADSKSLRLFAPHTQTETTAICIGVETKKIDEVTLEEPATEIREGLPVITDAHSTEVLEEEEAVKMEEAVVTEEALLSAQVQVRTVEVELAQSSPSDALEVQTAEESCEHALTTVAVVNSLLEPQVAEAIANMADDAPIVAITPTLEIAASLQNGDVTEPSVQIKEGELPCETVASSEQVCVISESVVLVSPALANQVSTSDVFEPEDVTETNSDKEISSQIEAQSLVIAQSVIQDAVEKVSEQPKTPESSTTPVQAVITTEKEILTEVPVITDTPTPIIKDEPAEKPLFVATECETVPVEVAAILNGSAVENGGFEKGLKKAVEIIASEEFEEKVVEIIGESQKKLEAVKEEMEEDKPQSEKETRMPVQVVLQTAQVVEEESIKEELVVEFGSNSTVDGRGDRVASEQSESLPASSKCAEVMAQVMEVIEEAVKEIQPASTEITPVS